MTRARHPMPDFVADSQGLREAYDARPPYQRNDYVGWISRAKKMETKLRRLEQMLEELEAGDRYMKMEWKGSGPTGQR